MLNKKGWLRYAISALIIHFLLLSACSQIQQEGFTTPIKANSPSITPQVQLSPTNTSRPFQSPTLTPSPLPKVECPIFNSQSKILEAKTGYEAEQSISDYLNQGGATEQLLKEIKNLGAIVDSSQVFIDDINDDGVKEIVVAINFAPPKNGDWEDAYGNLSIYNCVDGTYDVTKIAGEKLEQIRILAIENLLGSEIPEILVSKQWFFMSGCDEFVEIYSLEKQGWFSSFKTDESLCGIKTELRNGSAGNKELIIEGRRGCSYMACGPARGRKWTYQFGNDEVKLMNDELLPSPYRIHVLEDGEIAMEKGDLESAVEIYDKAARDNSLIEVLTRDEADSQVSQNIPLEKIQQTAHNYQTSFAYFREFVLLVYLNRDDEAEKVLDQIKTLYPKGKSGNEFVDISSYFLEQAKSGLSIQKACEVTNEYVADKYILGPKDFIYPHLNFWGDLSLQVGELLCPIVNIQ